MRALLRLVKDFMSIVWAIVRTNRYTYSEMLYFLAISLTRM